MKEENNRRKFLKNSATLLAAGVCASALTLNSCEFYSASSYESSGVRIDIDIQSEPNLKKIGWGVLKTYSNANNGIPVIILRLDQENFACYSAVCTHAHCSGNKLSLPLGNYEGYREIICSCHGSMFDPFDGGKALRGPAEKPLRKFNTEFNSETGILSILF